MTHTNINIREGIILIPDFSGFTEFVFNTKIYMGEYIVKQLLSTLIEANNKYFYISEIEGDAILLYKYQKRPSYQKLSLILKKMIDAFNDKLSELSEKLNTTIELSLKFIVHFGKFSKYTIRKFKKLYGKTIVEAHLFLKNKHAKHSSYILFSNSFLNAVTDLLPNSQECKYIPSIGMFHYI